MLLFSRFSRIHIIETNSWVKQCLVVFWWKSFSVTLFFVFWTVFRTIHYRPAVLHCRVRYKWIFNEKFFRENGKNGTVRNTCAKVAINYEGRGCVSINIYLSYQINLTQVNVSYVVFESRSLYISDSFVFITRSSRSTRSKFAERISDVVSLVTVKVTPAPQRIHEMDELIRGETAVQIDACNCVKLQNPNERGYISSCSQSLLSILILSILIVRYKY